MHVRMSHPHMLDFTNKVSLSNHSEVCYLNIQKMTKEDYGTSINGKTIFG